MSYCGGTIFACYSLVLRPQHTPHPSHPASDSRPPSDHKTNTTGVSEIDSTPPGSHYIIDVTNPSASSNEPPSTSRSKKVSFVVGKGGSQPVQGANISSDKAEPGSAKVSPSLSLRKKMKRSPSRSPQVERRRHMMQADEELKGRGSRRSSEVDTPTVFRRIIPHSPEVHNKNVGPVPKDKDSPSPVISRKKVSSSGFSSSVTSKTRLLSSCSEKDFSDC